MSAPSFVACRRVRIETLAATVQMAPSAQQRSCADCSCAVWVCPSTFGAMARLEAVGGAAPLLLCDDCSALRLQQLGGQGVLLIDEGQVAELKEMHRRREEGGQG